MKTLSPRRAADIAIFVGIATILTVMLVTRRPGKEEPRAVLERQFKEQNRTVIKIPYRVPPDSGGCSVVLPADMLSTHEFYARNPADSRAYVFINKNGEFSVNGAIVSTVKRQIELAVVPEGIYLFTDDHAFNINLSSWDILWVTARKERPPTEVSTFKRFEIADTFMREELTDFNWRVSSGNWRMNRHGGGMPSTEAQAANYSFQRAVNPFTVFGGGDGLLTYINNSIENYYAEARFYFGIPKTDNVVDLNTLPTGTDMMIVQGDIDSNQVAFGWRGSDQAFVLMTRSGFDAWRPVQRWADLRPPLTNWVRIGLAVEAGFLAHAYLDGVKVMTCPLTTRIRGAFHIKSGHDLMEFDDVRALPLPVREAAWHQYCVKSHSFGEKDLKPNADPAEFGQWAQASDAFVNRQKPIDNNQRLVELITAKPLPGKFFYEPVPHDSTVGALPEGEYLLSLYRVNDELSPDYENAETVCSLKVWYQNGKWSFPRLQAAANIKSSAFRFGRFAQNDGIYLTTDNLVRHAISEPVQGSLHLGIARVFPGNMFVVAPKKEHHSIQCSNLYNELFENAPTDWNWIEGAFRMDIRWACQDQWNFMACGGTGVPFMASKRLFNGDQEHEYFMSLRPAYPWDAGDKTFNYDPHNDPGYKILIANGSWYNRHNLNFSFCTDGKNPLSGYSIIFGGNDNRETLFLRKGSVLQRRDDVLFSQTAGHTAVHWDWWSFHVKKYANRIRVTHNGKLLFDVVDENPLQGGHIGFWTVRNGFTLARVVSLAKETAYSPHHLYVRNSTLQTQWKPLIRDSVAIEQHKEGKWHTTVRTNIGAGFQAVRFELEEPVQIAQKPVLELPVLFGETAKINVFIETERGSFLVPLSAPVAETKTLLTPKYEQGECFRIEVMPLAQIAELTLDSRYATGVLRVGLNKALTQGFDRVRSITVGNSSNENYLLAGYLGNTAGTEYQLGTPVFTSE